MSDKPTSTEGAKGNENEPKKVVQNKLASEEDWWKEALRENKEYMKQLKAEIAVAEKTQRLKEEEARQATAQEEGDTGDGDWILDSITCRKRHQGETHYHCKWKGHSKGIWMSEDDLLDEGWENKIVQFNHGRQQDTKPRSHIQSYRRDRPGLTRDALCPYCPKGSFDPENCWPDYHIKMMNSLNSKGYNLTRIQQVLHPKRSELLGHSWLSGTNKKTPITVFTTPTTSDIPGIIDSGYNPTSIVHASLVPGALLHWQPQYDNETGQCFLEPQPGQEYVLCCAVVVDDAFKLNYTETCPIESDGSQCFNIHCDQVVVVPCFLLQIKACAAPCVTQYTPNYHTVWASYTQAAPCRYVSDLYKGKPWPPKLKKSGTKTEEDDPAGPAFPLFGSCPGIAGKELAQTTIDNLPEKETTGWQRSVKDYPIRSQKKARQQKRKVKKHYMQNKDQNPYRTNKKQPEPDDDGEEEEEEVPE